MKDGPTFTLTPSRRRCLCYLGAAIAAIAGVPPPAMAQDQPLPPPRFHRNGVDQDTITIVTSTGDYPFLVDIVFDHGPPSSALRFQPVLARDEAVLYAVDIVRQIALSNAGVPFATDLLYIAEDGRIVEIHGEIMANDPTVFVSEIPVKAALQTVAGTVGRLDIRPGDHILHPMFGRTL